ncbi:hypothetical protein Krac_7662 [Ktedonobacter racemifer DSM 44963]|uniref:Uncharacterized protein n=1 Tax=Ktedonobacter racemifer DSM 44963 TaxID=485913 RepID=D6TKR8_KTERA|nr:hypothetical protein Krac_7662 [Ktedonobacter racemifer DSM 44963]
MALFSYGERVLRREESKPAWTLRCSRCTIEEMRGNGYGNSRGMDYR